MALFPAQAEPAREASRRRGLPNSYELGITIAFFVLVAVVAAVSPRFLTSTNLMNVARSFSFTAATAVGQAIVMLAGNGGIDLSVGSVISLSGVVVAQLLVWGWPLWAAVAAAVATGLAVGWVNGFLVTKARMTPLIPTLGMLSIAGGLALVISRGRPISGRGPTWEAFVNLGSGYFGPVPYPVIYMAVVVLIGWWVMRFTQFGYSVYAIGGNIEAARVTGIKVDRVRMATFMISAGLAAMTGVLLAARLSVGNATNGQGDELEVISAAVIGGISLAGGRGSVPFVVVGAAMVAVIRNAMVLLGVSAFWQEVVIGATIILAVLLDRLRLWIGRPT